MPKKETERDRMMREAREAAGKQKMTAGEWIKNMFLPHYLKFVIIALLVGAMGWFFVYDYTNRYEPDFTLVIATDKYFDDALIEHLRAEIADEIGDVNGDGDVDVVIQTYILFASGSDDDSLAAQMVQVFDTTFVGDPSNVLYLMHYMAVDRFDRTTSYELLADYGLTGADPYTIIANDLPLTRELLEGREQHDFVFKGWLNSKRDDPTYIRYYEDAVRVLTRIMSGR